MKKSEELTSSLFISLWSGVTLTTKQYLGCIYHAKSFQCEYGGRSHQNLHYSAVLVNYEAILNLQEVDFQILLHHKILQQYSRDIQIAVA